MQTHKKRLIENILSLSLLNGINMIIPLITLPYLIKTIGIASYGAYSIVYAMIQYAILFSSYGFSYSTTQQIAQNRDNTDFIIRTFNSVLIARILIAVIISLIMISVCVCIYSRIYLIMFIYGTGMILGDILNPTWLYQGMEKMRFMTIINFISKTLFTILIFIFIRQPDDLTYVTLLNSAGYIVAGSISLIFACKFFNIKLYKPSKEDIIFQFKSGWYIFLSTISMTLYRNSNIFILGFFVSESLVGIYSGAEKVIKAIQAITTPISNALFPYIAKSFKTANIKTKISMIKKVSINLGIILILITTITIFAAPIATTILLDNITDSATTMIRIMAPVIFFGGLNYILGIVGLINLNEQKSFFRYVMISGILSILILLLFVTNCGIYSAAYAMIFTELLLFILCISKLYTINHNINNKTVL